MQSLMCKVVCSKLTSDGANDPERKESHDRFTYDLFARILLIIFVIEVRFSSIDSYFIWRRRKEASMGVINLGPQYFFIEHVLVECPLGFLTTVGSLLFMFS